MGGVTRVLDRHAKVEVTPVPKGADVVIRPRDGYVVVPEVDADTGRAIVRVRREVGPRIGQRVKVGGTLIEVAERRYDSTGRLMLHDALTGGWHPWR